jgi:hypothetical protein
MAALCSLRSKTSLADERQQHQVVQHPLPELRGKAQ